MICRLVRSKGPQQTATKIRPSQAETLGYCVGSEEGQRLPDRVGSDNRDRLSTILGMISGCATLDLAMLRWIAYIKSLNPEIRHIEGKENAMADMLSRARFKNESDMVSEDEDVTLDFFKKARLSADDKDMQTLHAFNENEYEGEWLLIGRFLRTLTADTSLTKEEALRIRQKAYRYFLKGGFLWRTQKEG